MTNKVTLDGCKGIFDVFCKLRFLLQIGYFRLLPQIFSFYILQAQQTNFQKFESTTPLSTKTLSNIHKETDNGGSNNSNFHNCRRWHKHVPHHVSPNYLDHTGLGAVSILLFVLQSHKTFKIQVLFYLSCLNRNSIIVLRSQPMEFCNLFHIFLF